jgi:hypothetical protein
LQKDSGRICKKPFLVTYGGMRNWADFLNLPSQKLHFKNCQVYVDYFCLFLQCGGWIQGLVHLGQVLYPWGTPQPSILSMQMHILKAVLTLTLWATVTTNHLQNVFVVPRWNSVPIKHRPPIFILPRQSSFFLWMWLL